MTPTIIAAKFSGGKLARDGKRVIAISMYQKGKVFIGSALLVKRQSSSEATEYVFRHLLCQGIEVALKGLLLIEDYDKYVDQLVKPLGHNLLKVATAALKAYRLNPLRRELAVELAAVDKLYSKHLLRYGTIGDIFVDPASVVCEMVAHRTYAAIRLAQRELRRTKDVI